MAVQSESPRRGWTFRRIATVALLIVILGYILWFVLPIFLAHEEVYVHSYYWVANDRGEVRQLVADVRNNGTQAGVLKEVWIDDFRVENESWGGMFGTTIKKGYGDTLYVAPRNFSFQTNQNYNLTLTTSRRQYSFILNANENNTRTEKVKIKNVDFFHWPYVTGEPMIGVAFINVGGTDLIVKKVWINNVLYNVLRREWVVRSNSTGAVEVLYPWKEDGTYTVTIETEAGSTATTTATPTHD